MPPYAIPRSERLAWFHDARFGMFIHWGIYAIPACGEWVLFREDLPRDEYNAYADQFVPDTFDADAWVALARRAGAKYMVLTTRHHDGFCLFDSQVSDFTSVKRAARRDFVREYVDACHRAGMRVGLYYSLIDWQFDGYYDRHKHPESFAAMVDQAHAQVRELMTNYGHIDLLWYDGGAIPGADPSMMARLWRSKELNAMARSLQPHLLINDRSGLPEDFDTPEQSVVAARPGRAWEACMTIGRLWGYVADDAANMKPVSELLRCLINAARGGGNFLLNVGPRPDGTIQPEFVERLEAIGDWLKRHGDAIYGSTRTPLTDTIQPAGLATARGNRLFWHLIDWPGDEAALPPAGAPVEQGTLLTTGERLVCQGRRNQALRVKLPAQPPDLAPPVIDFDLGGEPRRPYAPTWLRQEARGHYDCPKAPLIAAADLAPGYREAPASDFCPGWQEDTVRIARHGAIELELAVEVDCRADLRLGLIAEAPGRFTVEVDGNPLGEPLPIRVTDYPDTWTIGDHAWRQGGHRLIVRHDSGGSFACYGFVLQPRYRPLPGTLWAAIGPFPTPWDVKWPLDLVKTGLETVHPPERGIDLAARYPGTGGKRVGWGTVKTRRGAFSEAGINFTFRGGKARTGVFYGATVIDSPVERDAHILIGLDWWGRAWLNGSELVADRDPDATSADGAAFNGWAPRPALARLRRGPNQLLVKCHRGSNACWFTCYVTDPGDLHIHLPA